MAVYSYTIQATAGGTTDPPPGSYDVEEGTLLTFTAIPDAGYLFSHWETVKGAFSSEDNPRNVVMPNYGFTTIAVFYLEGDPPPDRRFACNLETTLGGTAIVTTPYYSVSDSKYLIASGTAVTIQATADPNYTFKDWEGNWVTPENPFSFIMPSYGFTMVAVFEGPVTLTILSGIGGTTNPPAGTYTYAIRDTVTVEAIPDEGYYFKEWTMNGGIYRDNPINLIMNNNYTLTPTFTTEPPPPKLEPLIPIVGGIGIGIGFLWIAFTL